MIKQIYMQHTYQKFGYSNLVRTLPLVYCVIPTWHLGVFYFNEIFHQALAIFLFHEQKKFGAF